MEQNENNKIETTREENAEATQMSHEDNAATTQMSHEEMQKKLKKQRIRQIIASLIGVASSPSGSGRLSASSWIIMPTKPATMPGRAVYLSCQPPRIGLYCQGLFQGA